MTDRDAFFIADLPDAEAAERFRSRLSRRILERLRKDEGLFSDVLTLAAFSPLLAVTLVQHEEYFAWLGRKRRDSGLRTKEELIESLARFQAVNSQLEASVVFSRFRRRELLRIYLRDIRRLATIAQITEEISNLADAILETALQLAVHEMDDRYGQPQETDSKGRMRPASFGVVALGKLGSHELNYSSDIDLLFLYSAEGHTTGRGTRGTATNREYHVKLAQFLTKLVGEQSGEGGAYRVDLRLRPNGTMGALTMSVDDTVRYYRETARPWERQVMIRSRSAAGDAALYKTFFGAIENLVFSPDETPETALESVRRSKELIDRESARSGDEMNIKLSPGGIREIEFIAQALQLAYAGRDAWLRSPHTLISLARLADRSLISDRELTELSDAYAFLRRVEHVLQMENGLQTHTVPSDAEARVLLARRMQFVTGEEFETSLISHTANVRNTFERVFNSATGNASVNERAIASDRGVGLRNTNITIAGGGRLVNTRVSDTFAASPHFAAILAANPRVSDELNSVAEQPDDIAYEYLLACLDGSDEFPARLGLLRRAWWRLMLGIAKKDIDGEISITEAKRRQTELAEASLAAARKIVADEMSRQFPGTQSELSIFALGKLGGRGVDYGSDLDLVLIYDENLALTGVSHAEFYARESEMLVTTLSSMTRDGQLYRVDLRLRPFGAKGPIAISRESFAEYLRKRAEIWELLAFVKIRGIGEHAEAAEVEFREIIHTRGRETPVDKLREESLRIRNSLEKQRVRFRRSAEIDIKYGDGGMLDVYFAMRFLQLRDDIRDESGNRATLPVLERLHESGSLDTANFAQLSEGYRFLSDLDHNIRLTIGRSTRVPTGQTAVMDTIAARLNLGSPAAVLEYLTQHRLAIREAFEDILG